MRARNIGELIVKVINQLEVEGQKVKYNAVVVTDQNEYSAFLLNKFQDLFEKVGIHVILIQDVCFM